VAYVFVVDVDVNEVAQLVLLAVEVFAQVYVGRGQAFQRLARGLRFDL
jgi:hypothetical protein